MEPAEEITIHVVAGCVMRDGRVLLGKRAGDRDYAGCWEFPGGKVEAGEAPRHALRRELREELGIDVAVGDVIWRGESADMSGVIPGRPPFSIELRRAALLFQQPVAGPAHSEIRWFTWEEVMVLQGTPSLAPMLTAVATRTVTR